MLRKNRKQEERKKTTSEGDQKMLPPNMAPLHIDYFELKATENQEIQKGVFLEFPISG